MMTEAELIAEDQAKAHEETMAQFRGDDPVIRNVGYKCFVSRSKGRNRLRRRWKEIELIRYQTGWRYPHRAKLDEMASELSETMGDDELLWHISNYCGDKAGSMIPTGII